MSTLPLMGHSLRSHASRGSNYKLFMERGAVCNNRKCLKDEHSIVTFFQHGACFEEI